jgi:hypothetical protein
MYVYTYRSSRNDRSVRSFPFTINHQAFIIVWNNLLQVDKCTIYRSLSYTFYALVNWHFSFLRGYSLFFFLVEDLILPRKRLLSTILCHFQCCKSLEHVASTSTFKHAEYVLSDKSNIDEYVFCLSKIRRWVDLIFNWINICGITLLVGWKESRSWAPF